MPGSARSEAVDALLDVADKEQIVGLGPCQRKVDRVLQSVCVLVLVHQHGGVAGADRARRAVCARWSRSAAGPASGAHNPRSPAPFRRTWPQSSCRQTPGSPAPARPPAARRGGGLRRTPPPCRAARPCAGSSIWFLARSRSWDAADAHWLASLPPLTLPARRQPVRDGVQRGQASIPVAFGQTSGRDCPSGRRRPA